MRVGVVSCRISGDNFEVVIIWAIAEGHSSTMSLLKRVKRVRWQITKKKSMF